MKDTRIRLFLDGPLDKGHRVALPRAKAHYLFAVMRLGAGDTLLVFDGASGEWRARVAEADRRAGTLEIVELTAPQRDPPDLWLIFAPVKKARTDFIVEKAVEMGVRRIQPVMTEFTNSERVRTDRLQAHAVEAAEQCGASYVPEIAQAAQFETVLAGLGERRMMHCDEALDGRGQALPKLPGPWAVLVGPEGGFSPGERARLRSMENVYPVALGPRILRADTAVVAALAVWQMTLGDWRQ